MFDIGWGELVVIGVVALIAIGPKELPGALRTLGHWMGQIRRMASDFQNQFQEAMREAEMADLKKQVDTLTAEYDPFNKPPSAVPAPASVPGAAGDTPLATGETPSAAGETPSAYAPGAEASVPDSQAQTAEPPAAESEQSAEPPAAETDKALALEEPSGAKPGDRPA
ncbi:MAG TPA: Sec-independent protein translocase protein TatB [Xanthobacteraceae bacterium]|nr:Sec-independent protein translocase protein TatB [Xanthobacteraceae bacterium]